MSISPKIFIGSSMEAYNNKIPQALLVQLSEWAHARTWKLLFSMTETTIESLERSLSGFDAYVFILTPDDLYTMRNQTYVSPRDNLLFEIGFAMGLKGRENTFIIKQKANPEGDIRLPSDLIGVGYGEFYYSPDSIESDFESLSNKIRIQYEKNHPDIKDGGHAEDIKQNICEIQNSIENIDKTLEVNIDVLTGALESGVVNIYPSRNDKTRPLNDRIIKEFNTAKDTVYIQGITLWDYFHEGGPIYNHFVQLIKRNCPCKVLLLGPISKAFVDRVYWEVGSEYCQDVKTFKENNVYHDAVASVQKAQRFVKNFPNFEVRCYNHAPTCFLILTSRFAFTESYTYTTRGSNCPSLQIVNDGNNMYDLYKKHFNNLWESAVSVLDYDLSDDHINPDWFKIYKSENKYGSQVI